MIDLIVNDISFRRLPRGSESKHSRPRDSPSVSRFTSPDCPGSTFKEKAVGLYSTSPPSSPSSTPASSWTCSRCTLVNEKPHAVICEACESPRPTMEDQQEPNSKPVRRKKKKSLKKASVPKEDGGGDGAFDPFGTASVEAVRQATVPDFDPFETQPDPGTPTTTTTTTTEFNPFENTTPLESYPVSPPPTPHDTGIDALSSSLSGIDFSSPVSSPGPRTAAPVAPVTAAALGGSTHGDIWSSNIVNLDLKHQPTVGHSPAQMSAGSMMLPTSPIQANHHQQQPFQGQQHYGTTPGGGFYSPQQHQIPVSPMAVPASQVQTTAGYQQHYHDPNDPFAGLN